MNKNEFEQKMKNAKKINRYLTRLLFWTKVEMYTLKIMVMLVVCMFFIMIGFAVVIIFETGVSPRVFNDMMRAVLIVHIGNMIVHYIAKYLCVKGQKRVDYYKQIVDEELKKMKDIVENKKITQESVSKIEEYFRKGE